MIYLYIHFIFHPLYCGPYNTEIKCSMIEVAINIYQTIN